jgi:hypothetical protein
MDGVLDAPPPPSKLGGGGFENIFEFILCLGGGIPWTACGHFNCLELLFITF